MGQRLFLQGLFIHVSRRVLYLSILVHVLVLGFLQSCHRGCCRGCRSGGSGSNGGCCGSGGWLGEVTRGACVRGHSHSTWRGIWASRITTETHRTPLNEDRKRDWPHSLQKTAGALTCHCIHQDLQCSQACRTSPVACTTG